MARRLAHGTSERVLEKRELTLASHHRRVEPARRCRRAGRDLEQAVGDDRVALSLELERLHRDDADRLARQSVGLLPDQDLAGRRSRLQPLGDVDRIAGDERVAANRVACDHLPGVDADPGLDAHAEGALELVRVANAARSSRAARNARSASSSCSTGIPKTAMTASPMNFST